MDEDDELPEMVELPEDEEPDVIDTEDGGAIVNDLTRRQLIVLDAGFKLKSVIADTTPATANMLNSQRPGKRAFVCHSQARQASRAVASSDNHTGKCSTCGPTVTGATASNQGTAPSSSKGDDKAGFGMADRLVNT